MEQLVARRAHNPKVVGSSPAPATKKPLKLNDFRGFLILTRLFMNLDCFTVYILYSFENKIFYTGYTSDLMKRFRDHNVNNYKSFTSKHRPWVVLYTECYFTKSEAMAREKYLKTGMGREFIKNIIFPKYSILW
jgi:putative endonuclease